jgi:nitrogen fixation protein FixH
MAKEHRWPLFLIGILAMSIVAQGVLVFVATRADAPAPIPGYYQKALAWNADAAILDASRALGWSVTFDVPRGSAFDLAKLRPVDVTVTDRERRPIVGLAGRLIAARPADARLDGQSVLVELPQAPGRYRTLAHLPLFGAWDLILDANLGATRFVHRGRIELVPEKVP